MTKLILALDVNTRDEARAMLDKLPPELEWIKIGKRLFTRYGPEIVRDFVSGNRKVFLDLKFHDIPNTVAGAVEAALDLGVNMVNVHASGGRAMLTRAAEAAANRGDDACLIAVTVLTSMDKASLHEVGVAAAPRDQVVRLATLAQECGLDGVVASARESSDILEACGPEFVQVLPGIRPAWAASDDQRRIMTPADAAKQGAQFVVVGRPILHAPDPEIAARRVLAELNDAVAEA